MKPAANNNKMAEQILPAAKEEASEKAADAFHTRETVIKDPSSVTPEDKDQLMKEYE